jgi:hypothetical protein
MEERIEMKLRNHKDQPVRVLVKENLYRWSNRKILTKTHEFTTEGARTISFPIAVPKDGETMVRYRVRYTCRVMLERRSAPRTCVTFPVFRVR